MEAAAKFVLPVGFVFDPTDLELVAFYLYKKIANQVIPGVDYFIPEYDLYSSEEPWQIWNFFKQQLGEERRKDLYFFTKLKKKTSKGSRIDRSIGTGTWHGEDAGVEIIQENQRVGTKKRYRYKNEDSDQHGGWIMHEYSLDSSLLGSDQQDDYVVCRIRKNEPALQKNKREQVDSEKKKKRRKVQEVDSESQPLAGVPVTSSSDSNTIVQQPLIEIEDEDYGFLYQFAYEYKHDDSQLFLDINDIFTS